MKHKPPPPILTEEQRETLLALAKRYGVAGAARVIGAPRSTVQGVLAGTGRPGSEALIALRMSQWKEAA